MAADIPLSMSEGFSSPARHPHVAPARGRRKTTMSAQSIEKYQGKKPDPQPDHGKDHDDHKPKPRPVPPHTPSSAG